MPQHIWRGDQRTYRVCEVCLVPQVYEGGEWIPPLSPICRGEDEDDGARGRPRRRPNAPAGPPRVLEMA